MIYDKEYETVIKNKLHAYWAEYYHTEDSIFDLSNEIFIRKYLSKVEKDIGIKIFCLWLYEIFSGDELELYLDSKMIRLTKVN